MENRVVKKCYKCSGAGVWTKTTSAGTVVTDPCPICLGETYVEILSMVLPDGFFYAHEVYEAIDHAEYVSLTEPNEEHVDAIAGLGFVDLNEGSRARTVLWSLFNSESTTRANLIILIG